MREPAEHCALSCPRGSAAFRHIGGLVPAEHRPRRRKIVDFEQAAFELRKFGLGRLAGAHWLGGLPRAPSRRQRWPWTCQSCSCPGIVVAGRSSVSSRPPSGRCATLTTSASPLMVCRHNSYAIKILGAREGTVSRLLPRPAAAEAVRLHVASFDAGIERISTRRKERQVSGMETSAVGIDKAATRDHNPAGAAPFDRLHRARARDDLSRRDLD